MFIPALLPLSLSLPLSICFLQLIYYYYCCFPAVVWVVSLVWVAAALLLDSPRCVSSLSRCVYWIPPVASILRFEMFNQYAAKYIRIPESVKLWQTDRQAGRRAGRWAGGQGTIYNWHIENMIWADFPRSLLSLASLACHSVQLCKNCFYMCDGRGVYSADFNQEGGEQCMQKVCALPLEHGKYTVHLLVHK